MNFPDDLKYIETKLSFLKYKADWFGLIRIIGWMVLFVVFSNLLMPKLFVDVPYGDSLEDTRVIQMNTAPSDPRWVREDFSAFPEDEYKNIAWLAASSVLLMKEVEQKGDDVWSSVEFIPDHVNNLLEAKNGIKSKAFLYLIPARRILDTYTMALDAISRKPSAIVVPLDPFWTYNNKATYNWDPVFNHGARLWWNSHDWPMQFSLVSPSNHLWNIIGRHISFVSLRHDIQVFVINHVKKQMGGDLKGLSRENNEIKKDTPDEPEINITQSLMFWILFREYGGDIGRITLDGKMDVTAIQAAAMSQADTSAAAWSDEIVRRLLETLKNSGIPTLVYVAPVSTKMTESRAVKGYSSVLKAIRSYKSEYENEHFQILVDFPDEVLDSINFDDYVHLNKGGLFPSYLSNKISEMVKEK